MERFTPSRRTVLVGAAAGAGVLAMPAILRAQDKPSELIVRAWGGAWGDALKAGVADPFTAATGVPVRLDFTEDNEIKPKIWAAVDQGRAPPIHVNWDTTANASISATRGVCVDLSDLSNLEGLLPSAKPVGLDGWPLVNTYAYVYVLAYRPAAFPDGPPTTWRTMLDPKFKGRAALYDDGIGFTPVAVIAGGGTRDDIPGNMEPAWQFFRELKANEPLLGEDPDFTSWFQNGEIDLACTISVNARAAKQTGIDVAWTIPVEGAKVDTDGLWIPKGLPANEEHWAKEFINYALTAEAQEKWCGMLGLPPVRPGITPPADLVGDPSYPTTEADYEKLVFVPAPIQVQTQADWFAKFNEIFQG